MKKITETAIDFSNPASLRRAAHIACTECSVEPDIRKARSLQIQAVGLKSFSDITPNESRRASPPPAKHPDLDPITNCLNCFNRGPKSRLAHISADIQGNFPQG